jgi:hypothetical protein
MKALLFDVLLYINTPNLFLNARFVVGLLSAVLLGVQGKIAGRFPDDSVSSRWQDAMWWAGVIGAVLIFFTDTFWTLGADNAFSWLVTSLMLLAIGATVVLFAPPRSSVILLGSVLLLLVPLKILVIDSAIGMNYGGHGLTPFGNAVIWVQLAVVGIIIGMLQPRLISRDVRFVMPKVTFARVLNIMALAAGIGVVSLEILRKNSDWADMAVTILWAVCALILILFGMKRFSAAHRYFGLVLFGLTTLKVLLVDSSGLKGLERIAAFMGTGILLLILSFAYQKASAYFHALEEEK